MVAPPVVDLSRESEAMPVMAKVVEVALLKSDEPESVVEEKVLAPLHVFSFASGVEEAAVMVMSAEPLKEVSLMLRAVARIVAAPAVRDAAVPDMLVPTSAEGVPSAGVTKVAEVARTTSPVPLQVNSEEVANAVGTAEAPVPLARTVLAAMAASAVAGMPPAPKSVEVARTAVLPVIAEPSTPAACEPNDVVLPTLVTTPERLALVVTVPAVKFAAVPEMFVPTSADGVPRAGVTRVAEGERTPSPVPVQVKRDEVASEVASAVALVTFARTELADTCARLANGRSPVTPVVSGKPVALVSTSASGVPSHEEPEIESWVVEALIKEEAVVPVAVM